MRITIKPSRFMELGRSITHRADERCFPTELRRFRAFFGVSPSTCALVWGKIQSLGLAPRAKAVHLLWAFLFLNLYDPEEVIAGFLGVDEQTYREWSWELVKAIAKLKPHYILWSNRHRGDTGKRCKISVDGTDFILPQQHPKKRFYTHKHKCSGYRYEVAVCIISGDIVWINGPFPCGAFPDINIFRRGLMRKLLRAREWAQADLGYRGEKHTCIIIPNQFDSDAIAKLKNDVRGRHETVNKRFKQFAVLKRVFRHEIHKHKAVFEAVAVLTQIGIGNGEELYDVQYGHLPLEQWRARRR